MKILGIDPGVSGCLAVMEGDSYRYIDHLHMPLMKSGARNRINGAAMRAFILQHNVQHVFIELVGPMPQQGGVGNFSFGHAAGGAELLVVGIGLPYTMVRPEVWKKRAGLIGTDKDAARSRAIQLYPGLREFDLKAKGQALADAMLIARFGGGV